MKLNEIKPNKANPRVIKDDKFKKLVRSLQSFPQMMQKRPIVVDSDMTILGGSMRYKALVEIYGKSGEIPDEWVTIADGWTDEQKREFIIKDNASYGEWNNVELLEDWTREELREWGVDVPELRETEKLSDVTFESIYYQPKNMPNIRLEDCIDTRKYDKKIAAINECKLSEQQKEVLRMFAYRFIKIDFESVANYYAFCADDEEKKAIERLRLVLVDNGVNGFIEDDMLRIHKAMTTWEGEDE